MPAPISERSPVRLDIPFVWPGSWIMRHPDLNVAAKLIYISLTLRADDGGHSSSSYAELAADAGVAEATAVRAVRRLERAEAVSVERRPVNGSRHQRNIYTLHTKPPSQRRS